MFRQASTWILVVMLSVGLGFHWAALQSVAWVGMLASYSTQGTLSEALQKTFDGQHPCRLCKLVAEGRQSSGPSSAPLPLQPLKIEGILAAPVAQVASGGSWRITVFLPPAPLATQFRPGPVPPPPRAS